jgi:putative radical SAM enzyme (TIGR03279 family)
MPLKIASIEPKSLASAAGIEPGTQILSINGELVRDFLDFEQLSSDYRLDFMLQDAEGKKRKVTIYREQAKPLGIYPEAYRHRNCRNHCIFCFIDQMPKKLRKSLYMKDDDYVFSFVFGNYITLTNLSTADFRRIYQQQISPLYISLHSTDAELRQKMMRSANPIDPMRVLRRLAKHDISYHLQIVCVPGYNDGSALRKSLSDLLKSKLPVLSVGIVPVGLTRYRDGLCDLQAFDRQRALDCLEIIDEMREKYSSAIVYPADELFVLAGREIPAEDYYDDYPQLGNGIGMLRLSYENYQTQKRKLLKTLRSKAGQDYRLLCSSSAKQLMSQIVKDLNRLLKDQVISLQVIRNDYLGEHISVAGLITYEDLATQAVINQGEIGILPSSILNHDGYTLDGYHKDELKALFPQGLLWVDPLFEDWAWA